MKIRLYPALFLATLLLGGCSSTQFVPYHGAELYAGKEVEPREVDGIDFWEDGEPARKYRILGLVEQKRGQRLPLPVVGRLTRSLSSPGSGPSDSTIAKAARKQGGDGVIFLDADQSSSDDDDFGGGHHRHSPKFVVIKYAE